MDAPPAPTTTYDELDAALRAADADAFVHVGDRFDDLLRYLTRFGGPDREYAFVYAEGRAVLCAPALFAEQAAREFPGTVRTATEQSASDACGRALEELELMGASRVLVSPSISAAAYRALEAGAAGVEIASVDAGRPRKTAAERACHAFVQTAAQHGMARAEAVLAAAEIDGDDLRWDGEPLTTERLRREVNATLAARGVRDAGNTVVGAGATCADLHFTGEDAIRPGETVLLDVSPRGPHGYYGDLTRTFVAGEIGEWEATAYEAVAAAQDAALEALEAGAGLPAASVHEAATGVLADYGFDAGDVTVGMSHGVGHGVGVSLHEAPSLTSDSPLEPRHVVTVEPGVYDPETGGVRIEDLVVVTEDGYENLTDYPRDLVPDPARDCNAATR